MVQQIVSFEMLIDKVKDDGVFICEDTHTSYWYEYNGGLRKKGTFIEYSKGLVDHINAWHIRYRSKVKVDAITRHINSIHFYDSIVVFEKTPERKEPYHLSKGVSTIKLFEEPELKRANLLMKLILFCKKPDFFNRLKEQLKGRE
jgi:hypothetical protein